MDDILQAVDVHVGAHIFEEAILKELKNKTRILVTHHYNILPHADQILYFENGTIVKAGSYQQLLDEGVKLLDIVNELDKDTKERMKKQEENNNSGASNSDGSELQKSSQKANESSSDASDDDGKLVGEEEREIGTVKLAVIKSYFQDFGWKTIMFSLLLFCLSNVRFMSCPQHLLFHLLLNCGILINSIYTLLVQSGI